MGYMGNIELELDEILNFHISFYRKLPANLRYLFRRRVFEFMKIKQFRDHQGERPSFEKRVAVSAAAIQVTFGYEDYLLDEFHTLIIYPEEFISPATGAKHLGEVNPLLGVIAISWKNFVQGMAIDNNHFNVGLHEMAHAFYFNTHILYNEISDTYDFLSRFLFLSEAEIIKIRNNQSTLFRKYAGENAAEFFAIAVEYFFEEGANFKEKLPELYHHLCIVLKMDPLIGVYRDVNLANYFTQRNFDDFDKDMEHILLDYRATGFRVKTQPSAMIVFAYFFTSLLLFPFIYEDYNTSTFLLLTFIFASLYLLNQYLKRRIEASANYLVLRKNGLFEKKISGIHFDNIISIDLGDNDRTLDIQYFDKNKIQKLTIERNIQGDGIKFLKFLATRNIMLKNDGKRIVRVKDLHQK